jgi:hypothetical protein
MSGIEEVVGTGTTVSAGDVSAGVGTIKNPRPEITEESSDSN